MNLLQCAFLKDKCILTWKMLLANLSNFLPQSRRYLIYMKRLMSNSLPSTYQPLPAAAVQKLNARNQKLARKKTSHSPVKLIWARKFHSQVPLNLFERKKKKKKRKKCYLMWEFFLRSRNLQMSDSNKIIFALIFFSSSLPAAVLRARPRRRDIIIILIITAS